MRWREGKAAGIATFLWEGLQPRPEATQICRSGFSRENLGGLEGPLRLLKDHDQFPSPIYGA
ncbi:hypothetical protein N619_04335 [Ectopseudomonas oleovorans]|nr:hypothetical protein N619_04335 [Pseudomonas oleovorans]